MGKPQMLRLLASVVAVTTTLVMGIPRGSAATVNIVALGASNTAGKGVGISQAFPAQLQQKLRARGYDVQVANAGVNGDTSEGMLNRLESAVPSGTQIVILQPGGNDRRKGGTDRAANLAEIVSRLRAKHISVIVLDRLVAGVSHQYVQPDGQHLTAEGHDVVAERLLRHVLAQVGRRK
jgi:acyl-CoA thioesterase-1